MKRVETFTIEEFREWFASGFENHLVPDRRHLAFRGSDLRLDLPLIDELAAIHAGLPPEQRGRFRHGLVLVPRALPPGLPAYHRILRQVFMLAGRIGLHEIIPVAHGLLTTGSLSVPPAGPDAVEARMAGWNLIAGMMPHPDAEEHVRAAYFREPVDEALLELFFLAQCRARPTAMAELFVEYVWRLGSERVRTTDLAGLVYGLLGAVGLEMFVRQLPHLPYSWDGYWSLPELRALYLGPDSLRPPLAPDNFTGLLVLLFLDESMPFRLKSRDDDGASAWEIELSDAIGTEAAVLDPTASSRAGAPGSDFRGLIAACAEYQDLAKSGALNSPMAGLRQDVAAWFVQELRAA